MNKPPRTSVLIAGGGVAALEAAVALRELADDHVDVELVGPEPAFWYRPVAVAEPFGLGEVRHFDLAELADAAGALLTLDALQAVDVEAHEAHFASGAVATYDALVVACGAIPRPAVPGALTFRGPGDTDAVEQLLAELEHGAVRRVAFVVPWGATWPLPAYELALMTAAWLDRHDVEGVELSLVTPERRPLELFGRHATDAVAELLDERSITVHAGAHAAELAAGHLLLAPEGAIPADRAVALPRLEGPRIDGLTQTIDGFLITDAHGRVVGADDVYAAGDVVSFPVKHGSIATEQADVVAETIAAGAGADVTPQPFRPIVRGLLLTGSHPRYMRRELEGDDHSAWVSETPIWWPPTKVAGRFLSPFLAEAAGTPSAAPEPPEGAIEVEARIEGGRVDTLSALRSLRSLRRADVAADEDDDESPRVGDLMSREILLVAPEDTIGEVAERMRGADVGSALVAEFGQLVGILTSRDLLRALAGRTHSSEARVRQWMTADPIVVTPDATATEARILMRHHGIHRLPVVDGERPVGMIGLRAVTRPTLVRPAIGLGF